MRKQKEITQQRNQGEGNRTAAREYNEAQRRFVTSSQVADKAREAAADLSKDTVRRELEHAETVGKSHIAGEDPEVRRSYKKN
jgi:hypothetical protein